MARARRASSAKAAATTQRPYHHGDLRDALVRTARDLLDEQGINALSLRAVARGAGVSSAAPYRHFPDKVSLLAAVAADGFRDLSRCMAEAADAAAASTPPADRFRALGLGYIRFGLDNPAVLRLMFGAEIECKDDYPELAETARNTFATLADTTESLVGGAGQRARSGALAAWSLVHGLSNLLIDGQIRFKPGEDRDALIAKVMSHLRIRD